MIHLHRSTRTIKPCGYTLLRHFIDKTIHSWYGILTCFPSPTAFALSLGPTNPGRINLAQETLGFRRTGFSPVLSLLVPTFSLLLRPALLTVCLHPTTERSPTAYDDLNHHRPVVSVPCLAPLHFRRRDPRPVSYYALFK